MISLHLFTFWFSISLHLSVITLPFDSFIFLSNRWTNSTLWLLCNVANFRIASQIHQQLNPQQILFFFFFFRNQIRSRTQWKEIWWDLIQCPFSRLRSFGSVAFSPPPETSLVPEMMAQKEWDWILCTFQLKSFKREARYSTVTFSGPQK